MPTQKRSANRVWKWMAGIILILVVLLGAVGLYLNAKWKPLLSEKIKSGIYAASDHLYHLDFDDIHLNLFTGSIVFDSLRLSPDSLTFNRLKARGEAPRHLFKIRLAYLKLSRIKILTVYFDRKLDMNAIIFTRPSIDMIYQQVPRRKDTTRVERTLYQQLSGMLKSIRVGSIKMVDADFDYYKEEKKLNAIRHLTVNIKDILIDSLSQYDTTRIWHAKNIGFELSGYRSVTKDKMYNLTIDSVKGSIHSRTLTVRNFKLTPRYPDLTFSRKYPMQKDRYDLSFSAIEVRGIDFPKLNRDGDLAAKKIAIGPAKVAVFLNRELPPPAIDKARNYPHNALKRLPFPAMVDTIALKEVDVAYTEYNEQTKERGTLRLENLQGHLSNVTNDSLKLAQNNHAIADLKTRIMGAAALHIKIDFNLSRPGAPFTYRGSVQPFSMTTLNPLSKPLGQIAIESGRVNQVNFEIQANERGSAGTVHFTYANLKVNLLKKDDQGKNQEKGLLSFLANTLLVKNDNPEKGKKPRVAQIQFSRVPQASFFNLMWKSIFLGIREIAGIGIVPMKNPPPPKK